VRLLWRPRSTRQLIMQHGISSRYFGWLTARASLESHQLWKEFAMKKALIITDTATIAFSTLLALDEMFDELQVCNTAETAARLVPEFVPDLIVVADQVSPRRSAAAVALEANVGQTPVILMCTGLSSVQTKDPYHSVRVDPPLTPIRAHRALEQLGLAH